MKLIFASLIIFFQADLFALENDCGLDVTKVQNVEIQPYKVQDGRVTRGKINSQGGKWTYVNGHSWQCEGTFTVANWPENCRVSAYRQMGRDWHCECVKEKESLVCTKYRQVMCSGYHFNGKEFAFGVMGPEYVPVAGDLPSHCVEPKKAEGKAGQPAVQ